MKDDIIYLLDSYKRRLKEITKLIRTNDKAKDPVNKARYVAKRGTYDQIVRDLEMLLKDHEDDME